MSKLMDQPVCILDIKNELGESPLWSPDERVLYWIDILKGTLFRFDPDTQTHEPIQLHQLISSIGLCKEKKLIIGLKNSVSLIDLKTKKLQSVCHLHFDPSINRLNDGKCDRQGHFWCTSMNQNQIENDTASLYKVSSNGDAIEMETHVVLGNGMAWSPDNLTFYFTQTRRFAIYAYDYDPRGATISQKRVFAQLDRSPVGGPDGLTVDAEGYVWSAQYGSGRVIRFNPNGKVDKILHLPVPRVTSLTFGGDRMDTLYITSAREGMSSDEIKRYPLSGGLFSIKPGVQGLREPYFLI